MTRNALSVAVLQHIALAGFLFAGSCSEEAIVSAPRLDLADWRTFEKAFVEPSGRIRDTANGDISHSEGQGYAMLFAVAANDEPAFRRLWNWTRGNLQIREDALLAWRWDPVAGAVTDKNNATDGDLLVAWALLEASMRWRDPTLRFDALHILQDIKTKTVIETMFGPAMLPGGEGFVGKNGAVTLNLSYWIFPALERFALEDDAGFWRSIAATGRRLLSLARYGQYALPSDWIDIDGEEISPSRKWPAVYGCDAIRIPIYLCLNERLGAAVQDESLLAPFRFFYWQPNVPNYEWRVVDDSAGMSMPPDVVSALRRQLNSSCASAAQPPPEPDSMRAYYETALLLLMRLYGE